MMSSLPTAILSSRRTDRTFRLRAQETLSKSEEVLVRASVCH